MLFSKTFSITLISAFLSALASFWLFPLDWPFLPFPLLAGFLIIFIQKESSALKFIPSLLANSLLYGFLAFLLSYTGLYLISRFVYHSDFPFWPIYNPKEYLTFSLVFAFISFLGGLSGIVLKGFYTIIKSHK